MLPWAELNRILEQHRLEPPRLRLTREGQPVPASGFLDYQTNRRRSGQPIPRLRAQDLAEQLRNGATLVLDAVDELYAPVTALAENLEREFHVYVQVNAYAGWQTSHGFDLHWDDHDVFIVQVAGRKQWKVYGMTRRYPLARDVEPADDPPTEPLWEGLLREGDLLYIPRGWWHVATPLGEPTLHLTVGISNPTGAEFLSWFVDRLRESEEVRRDLPRFAPPEQQAVYSERLRTLLANAWSPDLMRQFLDELDARAQPRARIGLPWTATLAVLPVDATAYRVRWSGARPLSIQRDDAAGEITVDANGRRWRFAAAAEPILKLLASGHPCSKTEVYAVCHGIPAATVDAFLKELVVNGLAVLLPGT
ncbi:MAG TPA: cupin domain-containing protein [Bryobacteraceae bacterium]|nr:cupin domain-containing protein [Bryobacteraceae bacterium]